nr:histidine kinase [Enterocloster clostridioformis]
MMRAAFSCTDEKQLLLKYKMLQAQINPHFLYNTLNSIHWMVRAGRNEEAADMTVALGEILRAVSLPMQIPAHI